MAPEYRRADNQGGTYFFTVNTFQRRPILIDPCVRKALREAILCTRDTHPFQIDAWVLLPDHLHCIWTLPPGDADFSSRWGFIKRFVSQHCAEAVGVPTQALNPSRRKRQETGIWQRRFGEHLIRGQEDFNRHADYIHWNPVKHEHVQNVVDWPYSTFPRYVQQRLYPSNWGGGVAHDLESERFGE